LQVADLALEDAERVVEVLGLRDVQLLEAPGDVVPGHLALPLDLLQEVDEEQDAVLDRATPLAQRARRVEGVEALLRPGGGSRGDFRPAVATVGAPMSDPAAEPARARHAAPPGPERLVDDGPAAAAIDRVLREPEYRERLSREIGDLFRLEALLRRGLRGEVSRRFCLRLAEEAERVEYGLLDVGARGNRAYAFLVEAVAGVRWTAKAIHALLHLRGRIVRYLGDRSDLAGFRRDL